MKFYEEERFEPFELAIYSRSPFGYWATTLAIFVLSLGSYLLIATLTQAPPLIEHSDDGRIGIANVHWVAFVTSLIFTIAPALTGLGRRHWIRLEPELLQNVRETGADFVIGRGGHPPKSKRNIYRWLFGLGFVAGIALTLLNMTAQNKTLGQYASSVGLWFSLIWPFIYAFGFRAVYETFRDGGELKQLIRRHVEIDLFNLDRLEVFGAVGLRSAFSWVVVGAVLLLLIVDPGQVVNGLIAVGLAIGGAVTVFVGVVRPVHERIKETKDAELKRVHATMASQRVKALEGMSETAAALAGLVEYEKWVEDRSEWPISPSVTGRLAFYALIPVVPIIGSYAFERFLDFILF